MTLNVFREIIDFDLRKTVTSLVADAVERRRGELGKAEGKSWNTNEERERERRDAFRGETHGSRAVG